MIIAKCWIKLSEVRERLLQHLLENEASGQVALDVDAAANALCWDFCEQSKRVFLHSHGDQAIEYPKNDLIGPPEGGKHLQANKTVDLSVGVPGSGTEKFATVGKGPKIYSVSGPYIGSPVLFERKEFENFLLKLKEPSTASTLGSIAGIKEHLLKLHKSGTYTNKNDAWEPIKSAATWQKFNQGFMAAKQEDPTFGKVGKPPSKQKQNNKPND